MGTEKEVAAFVDRISKRLNDNPRASHSGKHRAAFVALRPLIEGAIAHGYTMKAAWAALRDEKKLSMSYQTFRALCRQTGVAQHARAPSAPAVNPQMGESHSARDAPSPAAALQHGFRHERIPRKGDIYG